MRIRPACKFSQQWRKCGRARAGRCNSGLMPKSALRLSASVSIDAQYWRKRLEAQKPRVVPRTAPQETAMAGRYSPASAGNKLCGSEQSV